MRKVEIRDTEIIWIPTLARTVTNNASKTELEKIHNNPLMAKELVYLMASQLIQSYHLAIKKEDDITKRLNSKVLRKIVHKNYSKPLNFLINKGVIKRFKSYEAGVRSMDYFLTENAILKGITEVKITNPHINNRLKKYNKTLKNEAKKNTIASYLLKVYPYVTLPSRDLLLEVGKQMVKDKCKNKKGKLYKFRGKKSKESFQKKNNIRCIEDDIQLFENLTKDGIKIPSVGSFKSGGRVTCAISLTPRWIRKNILIDNEKTIEVDFSALHPNIANSLWGDNKVQISHDKIANILNMDRNTVKIEHLSFFNESYYRFANSILMDYYLNHHTNLYLNVLNIKNNDDLMKKKNTVTYKLFSEEVKLMSKVFEEFKKAGIKALYVYDAVRVKESDKENAKKIMNDVAKELNVLTTAEFDN